MKLTNRRNRFVYRLWAPVYDAVLERFFHPGRLAAFRLLGLRPGERLLLLGVGTGADLPLLPEGVEAVGIDLSPEMLQRARARLPLPGRKVTLLQGDAQQLLVEEAAFDAVALNLVLSVVPDASACLHAAALALKPGGRMVVFDKFLPDQVRLTVGRRLLNFFSTLFGTDVNRRFGEMSHGCGCVVIADEPSLLGGLYRVILLDRTP
jgi:ubiquinone/menaquinone biosynthesis C-methylase UbiE